jgi:hypothetical protein
MQKHNTVKEQLLWQVVTVRLSARGHTALLLFILAPISSAAAAEKLLNR